MGNPARTLHDKYTEWQERLANGAMPMGAVVDITSPQGVRDVSAAVRALLRIDEVLTSLEADGRNVAVFRRQYPQWWQGVTSFQAGWSTNISGPNIQTPEQMDDLESLANYLEDKVLEISSESVVNLRELLTQARTALEDDTELSGPLRTYLHRLLQEMQNALDDDAVGVSYDFAEAVQRLYVAFQAAEGEGTSKASWWSSLKARMVLGGTGAVALEAASIAVQKAIGM